MSHFLPAGNKAREVMKTSGFLLVLEGSVRSMKTVTSLFKWYHYVIASPESTFLMSGNTLGSISRNCILGDFGLISISGNKAKQCTDTDGSKYLRIGKKIVYYCGADDSASYKKIRGLSIGGWYADEINLQHKDFIETAFARSFASVDRMNIWTLNPDTPSHWIYAEYIDKYLKLGTPGYHWFHFTLDDNPAISETRKKEIAQQYTGVFYKRYVLGLRVRAEGAIYTSFIHNEDATTPGNVLYEAPKNIKRITFGVDFGGHKSATVFVCTGWFFNAASKLAIVTLDYKKLSHVNMSIGPKQLNDAWFAFQKSCRDRWPADRAFADSAEQVLIKGMNQIPLSIRVDNAMKRPINDRVRAACMMYAQDKKFVMASCAPLIEAIENATYNEKADEDERLDDGSTDIDSLDADEYSWERNITDLVGGF